MVDVNETERAAATAGPTRVVGSGSAARMAWQRMVTPLPAIVVFLFGCLATIGLWGLLEAYRASEMRHATSTVANGLRRLVETHVEDQVSGLEMLADFWSRHDVADPQTWIGDASLYLRRNSSLALLAVVALPRAPGDDEVSGPRVPVLRTVALDDEDTVALIEGSPDLVAVFDEALPPPILRLCERAEPKVGRGMLARLTLADRPGVGVGVPMENGDVLVGVLDTEQQLRGALAEAAHGFTVSVTGRGGEPLYERPTASPPARFADRTRTRVPVEPAAELSWELEIGPTASTALAPDAGNGVVVVGICILVSILLGATVYLGQVARVHARATELANRELRARLRDIRTAQEQVRALNRDLEARVAERTEALRDTVEELETFSASISHDLRSPLGAILNFSAILEEDHAASLGAGGSEMLRRIDKSARAALSLMGGLMEYARVRRHELRREPVDMGRVVRSVVEELEARDDGRAPRVEVGELPSPPADAALVRLVWANLLSNAYKFTRGRAGARIEVGARVKRDETVFHVRDNGVGFDMADAHRLFGAFERLHPSEEFEGHGMGLVIVQRIVRRHGGRVGTRGIRGRGAVFYFTLPNREEADGRAR